MIPTSVISCVFIRPVELAMAFGGVEMGNSMANEVEAATQTNNVVTPPYTARLSAIAVPTTARMGTRRLAAEELAMKLAKKTGNYQYYNYRPLREGE